jgi:hypothetical protein
LDYTIGRAFAKGGGGTIYLAQAKTKELKDRADRSDTIVAKVVLLDSQMPEYEIRTQFHQEISILWMMRDSEYIAKVGDIHFWN